MKSAYEIVPQDLKTRTADRAGARLARRGLAYGLLFAICIFLGAVAWNAWQSRSELAYNTHNLIRLHVVGNSDSQADQAVKLAVRDAILEASGGLFSADAPEDAAALVKDNLPLFRRVAEEVLDEHGYDYPVRVEYGVFAFPERAYGSLVLPAGDYRALRVVLGEGKGANWWCVLFPPLCYLDVVGGATDSVGGATDSRWAASASGTPAGRESGPVTGYAGRGDGGHGVKAVSLASLTPEQMAEIERLLGQVAQRAVIPRKDAGSTAQEAGGVGMLLTDAPGSDADLVILVADTGRDEIQVRFYIVDRLRDLLGSLARALPWLFGGGSPTAEILSPNPQR